MNMTLHGDAARATGIDRSLPVPFYYQLKQRLLRDIHEENRQPGDRLPGDHELCARFGVSRTVVRQALSELEAEGVIERIKGRGTFVAQPKTGEGLFRNLRGLHEDVTSRGGTLRSDVLRQEVVPADERIAEVLQLEAGDAVIVLERVRYIDEEPWVHTITHVPYRAAPGLVNDDLTQQSLYRLLETSYGLELVRGHRSLEVALAPKALAKHLRVETGDAVLVLRSVTFGTDGKPVEMFVAYHRGDRSRFEVDLDRVTRKPALSLTRNDARQLC